MLIVYPGDHMFIVQVIRRFVLSAEDRAEEASQEAKASKVEGMDEIDDLDIVFTPEK